MIRNGNDPICHPPSSSLSYSFNKYLLSRYYIPGIVLAIKDTALKKTKKRQKNKDKQGSCLVLMGCHLGSRVAVKCTGHKELSNTKISHRRRDILKRNKLTKHTHKISHQAYLAIIHILCFLGFKN